MVIQQELGVLTKGVARWMTERGGSGQQPAPLLLCCQWQGKAMEGFFMKRMIMEIIVTVLYEMVY